MSFSETNLEDDVLHVPAGDARIRWLILIMATVTLPLFIACVAFWLPECWWFLSINFLVLFGASIFPEREIRILQRNVTLCLRFLERITVFHWRWAIKDSHVVQIHVSSFGSPKVGIQGYVHKVVAVEKYKRIILRDFVRANKSPDHEIEVFAESLAQAFGIPYHGYSEKPGFFWW